VAVSFRLDSEKLSIREIHRKEHVCSTLAALGQSIRATRCYLNITGMVRTYSGIRLLTLLRV
jgi:hypothetical protein